MARFNIAYPCLFLFLPTLAIGQSDLESLKTVAEAKNYEAPSTSEDVDRFVEVLASQSGHVSQLVAGQTVEGRDIKALLIANPPITSAKELQGKDRLVALLLGNIHAGESAGREALLQLARELAAAPDHDLLKHLVVLIVPNYNADGNDRIGKHHRTRQAGPPLGSGLRENAQALDLNRDFTKIDAPETRTLIRLLNEWNPHLFIDTHTTNGSFHRYRLTYAGPRNPTVAPALREYVNDQFLPAVRKQLDAKEIATFTYGNFDKEHSKWTTFGHQGRYSTEYVGLRGRIAILSEAYAYTSYASRIEASRLFVESCLQHAASNKAKIADLLNQVQQSTLQTTIALAAENVSSGKQTVAGFDEDSLDKDHFQATRLVKANAKDYEVEVMDRFEATKTIAPAAAYVIRRSHPGIADRLLMHGVQVEQVLRSADVAARTYEVDEVSEPQRFQGRALRTFRVNRASGSTNVKEGDYLVRTNQPLGRVAAYLLEPECDDGLAAWGFFEHIDKGSLFPLLGITGEFRIASRPIQTVSSSKLLTLDEIYGPQKRLNFSGKALSAVRWQGESNVYRMSWNGRTVDIDAETGAQTPVETPPNVLEEAFGKLKGISKEQAKKAASASKTANPNGGDAILSFEGELYLHRDGEKTVTRLTQNDSPEKYVTYSPNGETIAYVRDRNLYSLSIKDEVETALTTKGGGDFYFGELDWVYQEEIYGRGIFKAFWWSPDSKHIAFLRLDETPVGEYTVANNIPVRQTLEITRYPKSGDTLPRVALGIVALADKSTQWIEPPSKEYEEPLIVRVSWSKHDGRLIYQTQNRRQTELTLFALSLGEDSPQQLLHEDAGAWVNVLGEPHWLKDGSFLWLSERTGFKHLYHHAADGSLLRAVTSGEWNVNSLIGVDPEEESVYYTGGPAWPREQHAWRTPLRGGSSQKLTSGPGSHSVRFSHDYAYFVDTYSNITTPPSTKLYRGDGSHLRTIQPNLTEWKRYYRLGEPEYVKVPTSDGPPLQAMMIKPPNFDPNNKYPVLCYIYSGPQAPAVRNRWSGSTYLWHQMLAQKGYVIWICDNQSASGTAKYAWPIYGDMGKEELKDIETGLAWLKSHPWIDGQRIGIWGWSYGGYMTAYALTHSKSFRVGISGAPVTDWKNYDAVYTERYMDLPQNNKDGYGTSSVLTAAKNLHGKLLIIHGTIDDNVHLGNTMQLVEALQNAGKPFQLMLYPQNRHGVRKPQQLRHLRNLMTQFVLDNL